MDLHRITSIADVLAESSMSSLETEMALCSSIDEKYTLLVLYLGKMASKYIALRPEQKLSTELMSYLVETEQKNWKTYDK